MEKEHAQVEDGKGMPETTGLWWVWVAFRVRTRGVGDAGGRVVPEGRAEGLSGVTGLLGLGSAND